MIEWKLSIGAILGVLLSVLLAHLFAKRRESDKALNQEIANFKELLVPALIELENSNATPAVLVTQYFPEHDKAARKLAIHLPTRKRKLFNEKWNRYAQLYKEKKAMGLTALIATEVDDLSHANANTSEGIKYIYEQTDKRRQEVIAIINAAMSAL